MARTLTSLLLAVLLAACAPQATVDSSGADLEAFGLEPLPPEQRHVIAVPDFAVRAGSVRLGRVDLSGEGEEFFRELGSGVADIFLTEAFRSGRFRIWNPRGLRLPESGTAFWARPPGRAPRRPEVAA